jgi:predicted anti-sigma-YlaC factor YlaD
VLAHRFDPRLPEPADWPAVREHLRGCSACRCSALAADPSLLFEVAAGEPPVPVLEQDEAAAMRQAVAARVRAARVEEHLRRERRGWFRWAAAAGLAAVMVSFGASVGVERAADPRGSEPQQGARAAVEPPVGLEGLDTAPLVEGVAPGARLYEMVSGDVAVVMIVDESLDV